MTDGGLRTAAIAGGNATYETSASGNFNALNLQSQTIRFHTAPSQDFNLASEKMRLTSSGNLGIGTTNPQYNLEIYSGDLGLGVSSTGTAKLVLEGDINNVGDVGNMDASIEFLHDNGAFGYRISSHNYAGLNALNFADNKNGTYTDILHLGTGGHVGIGTDSPAKQLDIDGDTRVKSAELQITSSAAFTTHLNYQNLGINYISQANSRETIFRNNAGTLMMLNSDGDLLIGQPTDTHDRLMTQGAANLYAARFNGSTNGSQSYGVRIRAGSTSVDHGFLVENTAGADLFMIKGDGNVFISGGDLFGTGVGDRITNNGVPYLLSGDAAASLTLQDVCDNGNTTTTSIVSTGPHISGTTGRFENAKISNFNASNYAAFGHENVADNSYAIRQHSNGNTHVNAGFSRNIEFRQANSTQGMFTAASDFFVGPSTTNNTFYVDISETNVGVGTYAPIGKLTVATTMSSSPTTQLYLDVDGSNTVGGGGEVIFNTSASAGALDAFNAIVRGQRSSLNDGSSDLTFLTTHVPTSATAAARMTIKDDGKVGIGANSPLSKLDVRGDVSGSGDFLGTGAGNRITNNGTPYLLSGDAAATLTLQDVTDNGNTTTNDIGAGTITGNTLVITGANSTFKAFEQANDDFRIGTDTADDISIITNGSRRLTVTDAGDVGIGTTSPDTKLHVKGTAIRFEEAGGSTRHFDIIPATAGVNHKFTSDSTIAGYEFYNNANNLVNFTNTEASFNPSGENIDFRVNSSGSTAIFVDASENRVGIGTNVPSQILDVYGSESRIALTSSAGRNTVLQQGGGHFHIKTSHANGVAINYNESSDGRLAIYSGTAENIRFASNGSSWITGGSVGIGTDSPAFKLDVVDFQGGALARFKDSDSSYDGIRIEGDANGGSITNAGSFSSEAIYMQNSINAMRFYTNGQERVRIASYGTVGINQSSPSSTYSLDVGGSIRMATAAPSLVLRETDSSNQEFSVFGLGGDFYVRDITQSTYPLKIEAGVANDTLVL